MSDYDWNALAGPTTADVLDLMAPQNQALRQAQNMLADHWRLPSKWEVLTNFAAPGNAGLGVMRSMDMALRPLTAKELEMAEVYRRILGGANSPKIGAAPPTAAQTRQADPPSFYEMWSKQAPPK